MMNIMNKARRKLYEALQQESQRLREALQLLDEPAAASLDRVPWKDVRDTAEQIRRQATTTSLLWCGTPTAQEARDKMDSYVNELTAFVLLCHGSTVRAGPTLWSIIRSLAHDVVTRSFHLMEQALLMDNAARKETMPRLAGSVWEACDAVKKAPSDNKTAVGRGIVQAGIGMKDVLRELDEELAAEVQESADELSENESEGFIDMGGNLSSSDREIAQRVRDVVFRVLDATRKLLHAVTKGDGTSLDTLESVLSSCKELCVSVEELGASAYPPQELSKLEMRSVEIEIILQRIAQELGSSAVASEFGAECDKTRVCATALRAEVAKQEAVSEIQGLKL